MKKQKRFAEIWIFLLLMLVGVASAPSAAQPATGSPDPLDVPLIAQDKAPNAASAALPPSGETGALPKVPVSFTLNDSMVKDKNLPGAMVAIATSETGDFLVKGVTDQDGKFLTELAPGKYFVSYNKGGYIPLPSSPIEVDQVQPNVITVTLSMMLESVGTPMLKRVQIVLNWGSRRDQIRDIDSHLVCSCAAAGGAHVCYNQKSHAAANHGAELDVDDTDWGGPETITVKDPPPGRLRYWVHNYTGPGYKLGGADVVVRVILGDTMAGEFRIPAGVKSRVWLPFKSIEVDQALEPHLVRFSPEEIARNEDQIPPPEHLGGLTETSPIEAASPAFLFIIGIVIFLVILRSILGGKKS